MQELVFLGDLIRISHGERADDDIPLLSLKSFVGVDGVADEFGIASASEQFLKASRYQRLLRPMRCDDAEGLLPETLRSVRAIRGGDVDAGDWMALVSELLMKPTANQPRQRGDHVRLKSIALAAP